MDNSIINLIKKRGENREIVAMATLLFILKFIYIDFFNVEVKSASSYSNMRLNTP